MNKMEARGLVESLVSGRGRLWFESPRSESSLPNSYKHAHVHAHAHTHTHDHHHQHWHNDDKHSAEFRFRGMQRLSTWECWQPALQNRKGPYPHPQWLVCPGALSHCLTRWLFQVEYQNTQTEVSLCAAFPLSLPPTATLSSCIY